MPNGIGNAFERLKILLQGMKHILSVLKIHTNFKSTLFAKLISDTRSSTLLVLLSRAPSSFAMQFMHSLFQELASLICLVFNHKLLVHVVQVCIKLRLLIILNLCDCCWFLTLELSFFSIDFPKGTLMIDVSRFTAFVQFDDFSKLGMMRLCDTITCQSNG